MKLTIIIATYNSASTLPSTLDSILKLDFSDWECVIIDGQSSDNTVKIIESYKEKDKRFLYISEPDKGIYDALNKGVKLATGEWIYILGSDDIVTKHGLGELMQCITNDSDVIYGNVYLKSKDGRISLFKAKKHNRLKYVMNCSHQGLIMKKSTILKLGGFNIEYKIRADFDLLQRTYLSDYKFINKDTEVAYFSETGLSSNSDFSTHIERYTICKKNKSIKHPFVWFVFQESKYIIRTIINTIFHTKL